MTRATITLIVLGITSVVAPTRAKADVSLLPSFGVGASLFTSTEATTAPHFLVGASLDCLHESGAVLLSRIETTEALDTALSLSLGWFGSGLVRGEGFALGLVVGPEALRSREGEIALGGRGDLVFSLWFDRVTFSLGAGALRPVRGEDDATTIKGQATLRMAPWAPWVL